MNISIALSRITPQCPVGKIISTNANKIKANAWKINNLRCHFRGLISFGEIWQNDKNSIEKIRIGCSVVTVL